VVGASKPPRRVGRHATQPASIAGGGRSIVDLHTHTTRSDGILEPEILVRDVAAAGVTFLAITDHDTLAGFRELRANPEAIPAGLELLAGVEINAISRGIPLQDGELHILGFGMDPANEAFEAILARQRASRRLRFERTVARLAEIGMPIDAHISNVDQTRDDALGRPTIARALIAAGFATSVEDAFRRLIGWGGPAYVPREGIGPVAAIESIAKSGGLPVLAHFSEAPERIPLLRELMEAGLRGLEVYYRTYDQRTVESLRSIAAELRLVATGGSDYHGDRETYAEAHAQLWVPPLVEAPLRVAMAEAAAVAA
jgi:predicted metal-dependent phosphoesterase TrpH